MVRCGEGIGGSETHSVKMSKAQNPKILIASENVLNTYVVVMKLESIGYDVSVEDDTYNIIDRVLENDFDLVMIDTKLPRLGSEEFCRLIKADSNVPVVVYAEKKDLDELEANLEAGADDYIVNPMCLELLDARIRKVLRNSEKEKEKQEIVFRDMVFHPSERELRIKNEYVYLTDLEYSLLLYLVKNKNQIVSREQIFEDVWHNKDDASTSTIIVYIRYLRRKIDERFHEKYIYTVRSRGYMVKDS